MAKKELENIAETEEATVQEDRSAKEGKVTTGSKNVKIQVSEPVDCIIAGQSYKMQKGKAYSVPSDVAAILCNSEKAFRV